LGKYIKFLIGIVAVVLVVTVLNMIGTHTIPDYQDILEMHYDSNYAIGNEDIKKYFQEFDNGTTINMYEYADIASVQDTLMYYYFLDKSATENYKIFEKVLIDQFISYELTIEELEYNVSEIVDVLYLFSHCNIKYDTLEFQDKKNLENMILRINTFIDSRDEKFVEMFTYKWKLLKSAKNLGMNTDSFSDWDKYEEKIAKYEEDKDVLEIIHVLFENNEDKVKELLKKYTELYKNNGIDIETYIVYMGLLSDAYSPNKKIIAMEDIYEYCMENFYYISPMARFLGFKAVISDSKYRQNITIEYVKMPINEDGMVSTTCIIMPTYRRLYSYVQICKVLGINLEREAIENWISEIDINQIRVDDLFYTELIFEEYPEYKIELDAELNEFTKSVAQVNIGPTNSFNIYSILKALAYMGVEAKEIYDKYMFYIDENAENINALEELWKMELKYLYDNKKPDENKIYRDLKNVQEELKIEYFYYALNVLLITGNEISEECAEYMLSEISLYRVDGGYYVNEEFKYVDIYRTYQCMFIESKIERSNMQ